MPNWSVNTLKIEADDESTAKIKSLILNDKDEVDFNLIDKMPEDIETLDVGFNPHNKPNWYVWSVEHWGAKWNATSTYLLDTGEIVFQTAWQEPNKWFDALGRRLNDDQVKGKISMNFVEAGAGEGGEIIYIDGLEVMNRQYGPEELARAMGSDDE